MIKSALLVTAICFTFVVPAAAQQTVKCDESWMTQTRTDIDAMTDKDKQAKAMENWEAANAAFKANNMEDCTARMMDTDKTLGRDQTNNNASPDNQTTPQTN